MESILAFKRAGADAILTYYAKQIAEWIEKEEMQIQVMKYLAAQEKERNRRLEQILYEDDCKIK